MTQQSKKAIKNGKMIRARNEHEEELFVFRADTAYKARCNREGSNYQFPCWASSAVEGDTVVLRNARGELARYRITTAGRLRHVEQ
jgi:hypothetical protein